MLLFFFGVVFVIIFIVVATSTQTHIKQQFGHVQNLRATCFDLKKCSPFLCMRINLGKESYYVVVVVVTAVVTVAVVVVVDHRALHSYLFGKKILAMMTYMHVW